MGLGAFYPITEIGPSSPSGHLLTAGRTASQRGAAAYAAPHAGKPSPSHSLQGMAVSSLAAPRRTQAAAWGKGETCMLALNRDLIDFWLMPWSAFFRATCLWFTLDTQPIQGRPPEKEPPRWMRPLFLQRWVAQAVTTRLKANPSTTAYRFGKESESCWDAVAWLRYDWRILRQFNEDILLWIFGMEADRLLRIAQEHPSMVGQVQW